MNKWPLPQWKDENPITYRKSRISNEIRKLGKSTDLVDKERIAALKSEYESLGKDKRP